MVEFVDAATIVEVKDVKASEAFYNQKLGFGPGFFYGEPPCFCIVSKGRATIFLDQSRTPRATPLNQYWAAYLYVDDIDSYAAELRSRGVDIVRGPEDQDYGCRDLDIRDPDGHVIGIGQLMEGRS
jgi:catechol 2,3-dioxygenase-like lactoylglutathione lyase family enzyme